MAKKEKKEKKATKKAKDNKEPSDLPLSEKTEWDDLSVEELEKIKVELSNQVVDYKSKRNYYIHERDTLQQFYDIAYLDITETQAKIKNTESEMERLQDTHRNDIRIYIQKVKHLEHDHKNNLLAISADGERQYNTENTDHEERKNLLKEKKSNLKAELTRLEDANQEEIHSLKELMNKELVTLRHDFENSLNDLKNKYENKVTDLKDNLELRRKMEIHEIEERKNMHINKLISNHEKAFREIKEYYYEITKDNLDLIASVNAEYSALKSQEALLAKKKTDVADENSELSKKLALAEPDVLQLRHKLQHYGKDKISLQHVKARLMVLEEQYGSLQVEYDNLKAEYSQVEAERNAMHESFQQVLSQITQKKEAKQESLSNALSTAISNLQIQDAQISEVITAANLDPVVLASVSSRLDSVVTSKNQNIKQLKVDILRVKKMHDDLVRVYEARLSNLGIPDDERNLVEIDRFGSTAPAGLI